MGETRVDLLHLLEDLRDAYPGSLEETILTEIIANALDSGAGTIRIEANPAETALSAGHYACRDDLAPRLASASTVALDAPAGTSRRAGDSSSPSVGESTLGSARRRVHRSRGSAPFRATAGPAVSGNSSCALPERHPDRCQRPDVRRLGAGSRLGANRGSDRSETEAVGAGVLGAVRWASGGKSTRDRALDVTKSEATEPVPTQKNSSGCGGWLRGLALVPSCPP